MIDYMVFNVSLNAASHIRTCNQMLSTEKFMVVQKKDGLGVTTEYNTSVLWTPAKDRLIFSFP